jgi:hypothetical protein
MHQLPKILLGLLALSLTTCSYPPTATPTKSASAPTAPHTLTEKQKIEKLIQIVADMNGATFIRKGTPYDCKAAAQFMQGKWTWKSSEIHTARDFIRICSAGGSGEGTPYFIKLPNGTQLTSADFLTTQLNKLESQSATAQ